MFWERIIRMFKLKEDEKLAELKEILSIIDYDPKLEIISFHMPINNLISLGGQPRISKNTTCYMINSTNDDLPFMNKSQLVRYASRAVRCRRQSREDKLETFSEAVKKLNLSKDDALFKMVSAMEYNTWGIYDADAQSFAAIMLFEYNYGTSLEEISQMVLMNASEIIERCGIR